MSAEQNKALVRRYFEALSGEQKTPELVRQYVDDESLQGHIAGAEAAFPGYRLEEEDMIAEGDKVVVRFTCRGTHQGEFAGVPATGRSVSFAGIIIYRIANSKVAEHWMQIDAPSLMEQLTAEAPTAAMA